MSGALCILVNVKPCLQKIGLQVLIVLFVCFFLSLFDLGKLSSMVALNDFF